MATQETGTKSPPEKPDWWDEVNWGNVGVAVLAALVVGAIILVANVEGWVRLAVGVAAGIGALVCLAGGCYFAYQHYGPVYGSVAVVLVLTSTTAVMVWIPKSRLGRRAVLSSDLGEARVSDDELAPGQTGVAESDLRPAGVARFGELRKSVVTEGEFITAGSTIVVTEARGSRVVVEVASENKEST